MVPTRAARWLRASGRSWRHPYCRATGAVTAVQVSDFGSEMGAASSLQVRADAVASTERTSLSCADACEQFVHTPAFPVRD